MRTPNPAPSLAHRRRGLVSAACAVALGATSAEAVTQADGTVIPRSNHVQTLFDARGEPLNALSDAAILPETFRPGCSLTFTLVSRGHARFQNAFGWYNVTGSAPLPTDQHILIPCGAAPGFVATLDVSHEPAYRGGDVGFFLRTPEGYGCQATCCAGPTVPGYSYFSQREFNPDGHDAGASYIHLLMYESVAMPHSFYFAWEDLFNGGDDEFTDLVTLVSNIVCSGGGSACDTGRPGLCGVGTEQCQAGVLTCVPQNTPHPEVCDDLDNDCNGSVDDGPGLCAFGQVCDRGTCLDRCVEFACFDGYTCAANGTCIETSCVGVTCHPGESCIGGRCVEPCDVIACPAGRVCRVGRCVDPCAGVHCDADAVCDQGVCQTRCECRGCAAGQSCGPDGRCIDAACATVTCRAGEVCVAGRCRNACLGAVCPYGEVCRLGDCEPAPPMPDAGARVDATPTLVDATVRDAADDLGLDASTRPWIAPVRSDCTCHAGTTHPLRRSTSLLLGIALLALAAARRRARGAPFPPSPPRA